MSTKYHYEITAIKYSWSYFIRLRLIVTGNNLQLTQNILSAPSGVLSFDPGTVDQLGDVDVHGGIFVISVRCLYLTERRLEQVVWQHISDTVQNKPKQI